MAAAYKRLGPRRHFKEMWKYTYATGRYTLIFINTMTISWQVDNIEESANENCSHFKRIFFSMKKQLHNNICCPVLNTISFVTLRDRMLGYMGYRRTE